MLLGNRYVKLTLDRLHLAEEIILNSLHARSIEIGRSAHFINDTGQILQDQFPRRIREALAEGNQVVATSATNVNQKRFIRAEIRVVEDAFADGEPVGPESAVGSLALHEAVEAIESGGILAQPGEAVGFEVVGVL